MVADFVEVFMLVKFRHINDEYSRHHRRYSESPSLMHDVVLIVGMLTAMVYLLY